MLLTGALPLSPSSALPIAFLRSCLCALSWDAGSRRRAGVHAPQRGKHGDAQRHEHDDLTQVRRRGLEGNQPPGKGESRVCVRSFAVWSDSELQSLKGGVVGVCRMDGLSRWISVPGESCLRRCLKSEAVVFDGGQGLRFRAACLQVKHIILCGHYECGAVRAAVARQDHGAIENWIMALKDVERMHRKELEVSLPLLPLMRHWKRSTAS